MEGNTENAGRVISSTATETAQTSAKSRTQMTIQTPGKPRTKKKQTRAVNHRGNVRTIETNVNVIIRHQAAPRNKAQTEEQHLEETMERGKGQQEAPLPAI
jgi:hypothetical protein